MSMHLAKLAAGKKNLNRDQILALEPEKKYNDGRTKQSFRDETDINKIIQRAEKTGTISHLNKHQGSYADFADFDYFGNLQKLTRGREIFDDLPAELRNEFVGSPAKFFDYVNDPANKDRLEKLLPGLAAPGRQLATINPPNADEAKALEASAKPPEVVKPEGAPEKAPEAPIKPVEGSSS